MSKTFEILVYTTKTCPYCQAAKNLLEAKGAAYTEVDVSDPVLRQELVQKAHGRKTVPQIFIGSRHVGGFDDLNALDKAGELDELLKEADIH